MELDRRLLALVAVLLATSAAEARPRAAKLHVHRDESAHTCPDEDAIRRQVIAKVGEDPFREPATLRLSTALRHVDGKWRAEIELLGPSGERKHRTLTSTDPRCDALAASVVLALAIAIDPLSLARPSTVPKARWVPAPPERPSPTAEAAPQGATGPEPSPAEDEPSKAGSTAPVVRLEPGAEPLLEPAEPPPPPSLAPSPVEAEPIPPIPIRPAVGLGPVLGIALGPAPDLGLSGHLRLRRGDLSISAELRAHLPSTAELPWGRARSTLLLGLLSPCAHRGALSACALVAAGRLDTAAEQITHPSRVTLPLMAVGARATGELVLGHRLSLLGHLDVLARLTSVRLLVNDQVGWASPPVAGAAGMALVFHFE